jgi:hypothetical protein
MEIKDYQENADKNRRNGKLGGRPSKTQSVSSGLPKETQSKGNHKPLTINQKPETTNQVNTPDGVSHSVWQEFVNHRKSKKAQVTQLVIDGIQKEADKAGFSLEDALKEVVVRNWQGFKAEWVLPKPTFGDMARVSVAPVQGRDPALLKLDEDKKHTGPPPPEIMAQIRNALKGKVT